MTTPAIREQLRSATAAFLVQHEYEQPDPSTVERLAEIAVPSTVLIGTRDHPMVAGCADAVAARIPGCHKVTVTEADHMLPLRVPDLVAHHVTRCFT